MHSPVSLVWGSLRLVQLIFTICGYLLHTEASCTQFVVFRPGKRFMISIWTWNIVRRSVCVCLITDAFFHYMYQHQLLVVVCKVCIRNGLCKSTVEAVIQCLLCRILPDEQLWTVLHQLLQWEAATVFKCQNTQRGLYLYGVCMFVSPGR